MTTGITDVEWLDAKVCELTAENERLRAAIRCAGVSLDHGMTRESVSEQLQAALGPAP